MPDVLPASLDAAILSSLPVIAGPTGPKVRLTSNPSKSVINLASYNFTGLAEHEKLKEVALDTLRIYGMGSCGPPGFYGTIGQSCSSNLERALGFLTCSSLADLRRSPSARSQHLPVPRHAVHHHLRPGLLLHLIRHPLLLQARRHHCRRSTLQLRHPTRAPDLALDRHLVRARRHELARAGSREGREGR